MMDVSPILVTGAHRTGTTWVGKMLAAHPRLAYISEPLNVWHRPGVMSAPVANWYTYIDGENENQYLPALHATLAYRYGLWREIGALRSFKDFLRMGRDLGIFLRGRLHQQRPLIKDPFAVFSAAWFAQRLGCKIVITVRHPAAFASSLKRLGWRFDFQNLLEQPLLLHDWLDEDRAEMEAIPAEDIIGQAALLWRMIYGVVHIVQSSHPEFIIVRHEDLSLDPLVGFRGLYEGLDLEFTPRVEREILNSSSAENPTELSKRKVHSVRLDSRSNLGNWKYRLSQNDIDRIRRKTEETAHFYYSDREWN
jgi:hypothetical protein